MADLFSTFGTTEFIVRQSIVPVVAWNNGDQEIKCIGTGFFISASGYLMTAAHVLRDPVDEGYTDLKQVGERSFQLSRSLNFGVLVPLNPAMRGAPFNIPDSVRNSKFFVAPIKWAVHWGRDKQSPLFHQKPEFELDLDIAVCKIAENIIGASYQPLNIGQYTLQKGDRAVAIGYPEMQNIPIDPNNSSDYQPELVVSVGRVKNIYFENSATNKQALTSGPCFEFDAKIPGKMSGSPILVGSGILTKGVVSSGWHNEAYATGCLIAPIMGLPLVNGKSLLDLQRDGTEGIAKIIGAGL